MWSLGPLVLASAEVVWRICQFFFLEQPAHEGAVHGAFKRRSRSMPIRQETQNLERPQKRYRHRAIRIESTELACHSVRHVPL